MSYICNPSNTKKILKKYNIKLNKRLGQNFLIDSNILHKIVKKAEVGPNDVILEIGSGIGTLTEFLINAVKPSGKVVCIEIDKKLVNIFNDIRTSFINFGNTDNIYLINADATRLDYSEIYNNFKITKAVSNLPYKTAAPLILKILIEAPEIKNLYFTIQKDIADRILAEAVQSGKDLSLKDYGAYTVKIRFLADCKILFNIPRSCFLPEPFVDSVFISIKNKLLDYGKDGQNIFKQASFKQYYEKYSKIYCNFNEFIKDYFNFIDLCFSQKRKKLINSLFGSQIRNEIGVRNIIAKLKNNLNIDKVELITKILLSLGKNSNVRAEQLKPEEFLILFLEIIKNI